MSPPPTHAAHPATSSHHALATAISPCHAVHTVAPGAVAAENDSRMVHQVGQAHAWCEDPQDYKRSDFNPEAICAIQNLSTRIINPG